MANNYVTINYDVRDILAISNNEYIACDLINKMSQKTGWTEMSRTYFADKVGISERGLLGLIRRIESLGLIEHHANAFKFKSTKKWISYAVEVEGEKSSPKNRVKKVHPQGEESSPNRVKKVHPQGEESSPHIYKDKEKINIHNKRERESTKTDFSNPTLPPVFSNLNSLDAEKEENTPLVPPPPPKEKKDVTMLSSQTEFENKLIEIFSDDMNKQELKSRLQRFGYSKNGAISRGQAELLFSVYADWHLREKDPDNFVYCLKPSKDKKDFLSALSWLISKEVIRNAFKESGSKDVNSQQPQPPQPQDLSLYYKQEMEKRNSRNAQKIA